jgi:hypothetical protein
MSHPTQRLLHLICITVATIPGTFGTARVRPMELELELTVTHRRRPLRFGKVTGLGFIQTGGKNTRSAFGDVSRC